MSRRRKTQPPAESAASVAREVTWDRLLSLFDKKLHAKLEEWRTKTGAEAVICFENIQTGERSALLVGDGCEYDLAEALAGRLNGKSGEGSDKIPIEYARCGTTTVEVPRDTGART